MEVIFNFEKLLVYQKALKHISEVYKTCKLFPQEEKYALVDQFKRAATSIALNIAEGTGGSNSEFKRFLRISRRSIRENIAIISVAKMNGYIKSDAENKLRESCVELSKMISGLIASLSPPNS